MSKSANQEHGLVYCQRLAEKSGATKRANITRHVAREHHYNKGDLCDKTCGRICQATPRQLANSK